MSEMDEKQEFDNIPTPALRLRLLAEKVSSLEMDYNIPAVMYYRSGIQLLKMGDMYVAQGSLKEAYLLYLRLVTLFLEKIREHPGFSTLTIQERKATQKKAKETLPKAEKLKELLREQYEEEYQRAKQAELQKRQRLLAEQEARRQLLERKQHVKPEPVKKIQPSDHTVSNVVTGPTVPLDSIVYPDADSTSPIHRQIPQPSAPNLEPSTNVYPSGPNSASRLPSVDRSTKPASLLSLFGQSQLGLRNVVVPSQLVERFLVLANGATLQNIETCGILAGYLDQNQLVISHLIIPKQSGTPDSCSTENEEDVFNYMDTHNLITLGWIHTHPSQTAFLSSVDLHTHCSYQLMMPEAVAIVCAPRYKDNSIFCLTPSYGLDFIAKCRKSGFHPHPTEPPLFSTAEHARLESDLAVEVVDLRR